MLVLKGLSHLKMNNSIFSSSDDFNSNLLTDLKSGTAITLIYSCGNITKSKFQNIKGFLGPAINIFQNHNLLT